MNVPLSNMQNFVLCFTIKSTIGTPVVDCPTSGVFSEPCCLFSQGTQAFLLLEDFHLRKSAPCCKSKEDACLHPVCMCMIGNMPIMRRLSGAHCSERCEGSQMEVWDKRENWDSGKKMPDFFLPSLLLLSFVFAFHPLSLSFLNLHPRFYFLSPWSLSPSHL